MAGATNAKASQDQSWQQSSAQSATAVPATVGRCKCKSAARSNRGGGRSLPCARAVRLRPEVATVTCAGRHRVVEVGGRGGRVPLVGGRVELHGRRAADRQCPHVHVRSRLPFHARTHLHRHARTRHGTRVQLPPCSKFNRVDVGPPGRGRTACRSGGAGRSPVRGSAGRWRPAAAGLPGAAGPPWLASQGALPVELDGQR